MKLPHNRLLRGFLLTVVYLIGFLGIVTSGGGGGGGGNNPGPPGTLQLLQTSFDATEGTIVNIIVARSGGSDGVVSVDYATADGTAVGGSDYTAANGTLTWASGVSGNQTISIPITDDNTVELSESFTVTLSNVSVATLGANSIATVTTIDNDFAVVTPLYPTNGWNWNDYVADDGSNRFTATDIACDRLFDDHYSFCIHAGEYRVVEVTALASCTGLTASDTLNAFNWSCHDGTGVVRVISSGLKDAANLSDLIDWSVSPPQWQVNSVTVSDGGTTVAATPSDVWWSNSIVVDNDGGSLSTAGTIYVVTSNPSARYTIDAVRIGLVIKPGVTLTAPVSATSLGIIAATGIDIQYLWIEGTVDASGNWAGIQWTAVNSSVMRNVRIANGDVHGVTLEQKAAGNYLSKLHFSNGDSFGLFMLGGALTMARQIISTNNSFAGIDLGASNLTLLGITASNNIIGIDYPTNSSNNIVIGASVANNLDGIITRLATNNTFENIAAVNNGDGVYLSFGSDNNFFANLLATNNATGVTLDTSDFSLFSGQLKVGNNTTADCRVFGSPVPTNPGLVDGTCTNQGVSDAILTTNVSAVASFVGKVITDDNANLSDGNGTASFDVISDWTTFDNSYRGWGRDGNPFADVTNRDPCVTSELCRIWDWSLANGDTGDNGSPALQDVLGVPTGNDTITHAWSFGAESVCNRFPGASWDSVASTCTSTFLRQAVEIIGDGFGNENGLCESNETCLFTPNIGAYQGQGNLISAGSVTGGSISGVTLLRYETNGN